MPRNDYNPPFWFDGTRYRDRRGRFVSENDVRQSALDLIARVQQDVDDLARRLSRGEVSLARWQRDMVTLLKQGHTAGLATARGGVRNLTQNDYQRLGGRLRFQLDRLGRFAQDIESGRTPLGGQLRRRSAMYGDAVWTTMQSERAGLMLERGYDEYRNVLDFAAEHCDGCLTAASEGWVPVGDLTPIGGRECLTNCRCHFEYRNSATGGEIR